MGRVLFHQIDLIKNSQSKLKSSHVKKGLQNKTKNGQIHNLKRNSLNLQLEKTK